MSPAWRRTLLSAFCATGALCTAGVLLAACGPAADDQPRSVRPLELPSEVELEIEEKLRDADYFVEAGRESRAEPLLRRVLELQPENLRARFLLAQALLDQGRLDAAVEELRHVIEQDPKYLGAYDVLSAALEDAGRFEEALPVYQAWTEVDKHSDAAFFGLGKMRYGIGDPAGSAEALRIAQQLKAARADVRSELGLALQALGKLEKAEEKQRDAIEREPNYAVAWMRLGGVIFARDPSRADEAVVAFRRAVELRPRDLNTYLYLYRTLELTAKARNEPVLRQEAQAVFTALLERHAREQLRGAGLDRTAPLSGRERDQREKELRAAVLAAPEDAAAHQQLAFFLHSTGRAKDALAEYATALEIAPDDAVLHGLAGTAHLVTGSYADARTHLSKATELDPALAFAWRNLGWLNLRLGDPSAAFDAYAAALEADPTDLRARKGQGLSLMALGDLDGGLREIDAAGWLR